MSYFVCLLSVVGLSFFCSLCVW